MNDLVLRELGDVERLAAAYAPGPLRGTYRAVLALDALLARASLMPGEALPAQLRLAWWRDACQRFGNRAEHPVLLALAANWHGSTNALVMLVDAWEELAAGTGDFSQRVEGVAVARGTVFAECMHLTKDVTIAAVRCWTLVTLSRYSPGAAQQEMMLRTASTIELPRLPRALRPLQVLSGLAQRAARRSHSNLIEDPRNLFSALRLGIFGR